MNCFPGDEDPLGAAVGFVAEVSAFKVIADVPAIEPILISVVEPANPPVPMLIAFVEPEAVAPA
jgi:hypothetical protein